MMALLLEPLQFTFMSHALLISLVVSIPCALLSVFLVLKGWALMGDAMSHAVFPGIVLAWILGLPLATGAFVAGVFCAVATGYLKDNSRIKQDTVMGIVFSGMFAAGLILYIAVKPDVHLDHILFGDMLGITIGDIIQTHVSNCRVRQLQFSDIFVALGFVGNGVITVMIQPQTKRTTGHQQGNDDHAQYAVHFTTSVSDR